MGTTDSGVSFQASRSGVELSSKNQLDTAEFREATHSLFSADGLQLRALSLDSGGWRQALVVEQLVERASNGSDIVLGNAERCSSETDLLDEVGDLVVVKVHELVYLILGWESVVRREAGHSVRRAAKKRAKECVQVREQEVLV